MAARFSVLGILIISVNHDMAYKKDLGMVRV